LSYSSLDRRAKDRWARHANTSFFSDIKRPNGTGIAAKISGGHSNWKFRSQKKAAGFSTGRLHQALTNALRLF